MSLDELFRIGSISWPAYAAVVGQDKTKKIASNSNDKTLSSNLGFCALTLSKIPTLVVYRYNLSNTQYLILLKLKE